MLEQHLTFYSYGITSIIFFIAWNGQDADPMTSDRLFTTFSSDERLVLYDYSVQNTEHPPVPSEFNM